MKRTGNIYQKITELSNIEAAMLSYSGWLKHCNSYNYQQKYIKPYVNYKLCKEVIRNESKKDRKHNKTT